MFSRFGINYNNELEVYKKGSVVFREVRLPTPFCLAFALPFRTTAHSLISFSTPTPTHRPQCPRHPAPLPPTEMQNQKIQINNQRSRSPRPKLRNSGNERKRHRSWSSTSTLSKTASGMQDLGYWQAETGRCLRSSG